MCWRIEHGAFSSILGFAFLALGHAFRAQGKVEAARAAFHSAAEQLEPTVGLDHSDTAVASETPAPYPDEIATLSPFFLPSRSSN
jgi:hypothetical protein